MLHRVHDTRKRNTSRNKSSATINKQYCAAKTKIAYVYRQNGMKDRDNLLVLGLGITKGYELRIS